MIRRIIELYTLLRDQPLREASFLALHVPPPCRVGQPPYGDASRPTRAGATPGPAAVTDKGSVAANLHPLLLTQLVQFDATAHREALQAVERA